MASSATHLRRLASAIVLGVWTIAPPVPSSAQPAPSLALKDYVRRTWNTGEGLPQSSVRAIAQSDQGYLWVATSEGLVRFDGVKMDVLDRKSTPSLPSPNIGALLADGDAVWVGLKRDGLLRLRGALVERWTRDQGLPGDNIQALARTRDGAVWACTTDGLARLPPGAHHFERVEIPEAASCSSLSADRSGLLWVGTSVGLARVAGSAVAMFLPDSSPARPVTAVAATSTGVVWVGTDRGLARFQDGHLADVDLPSLASATITALLEDSTGAVWIGTRAASVSRYAGGKLETLATASGLSDRSVLSLYQDRESTMWVGLNTGGLVQMRATPFSVIGVNDGLATSVVRSLWSGSDGTMWMGTAGYGVMTHRDGAARNITTAHGLPGDVVFSLAEAPDKAVWVGTREGLATITARGVALVPVRLPTGPIRALAFGRDGRLRVGTTDGAYVVEADRRATHIAGTRGVVRALHEARDGTWWVAGLSGLSRVTAEGTQSWTEADGLPDRHLSSLHENPDGSLWVATLGHGLFHFDGHRAVGYTSAQGLFDDTVFQIVADTRGWLWMTSNRGLFRSPLPALEALVAGERQQVPSRVYGEADGLPTSEFNGGASPAAIRAADGSVWFGSIRGAIRVDPARVPDTNIAPEVLLETLLVNGVAVSPESAGRVPPGATNVEVHYTARTLQGAEAVRFRYRLVGFDQAWVDAGLRRAAYYTNLPPGSYRFELMASRDGLTWGPSATGMPMTLLPRFYQTRAFAALSILAMAGAIAGGVRLRERRRAAHERELEELVALRTRELEQEIAEHRRAAEALEIARAQALQASELKSEFLANVSHEIRTPMNGVIGMTDLALEMPLPDQARRYLDVARSSADLLLQVINDVLDFSKIEAGKLDMHPVDLDLGDELSEIVTLLTPRASARSLTLSAFVDPAVPTRVMGDPVRMRQVLLNLVSNALKFTEVGSVRIEVALEPGQALDDPERDDVRLHFRVIDTGVGIAPHDQARIFDAFTQVDGSSTRRHGGTGLGLAIAARLVEMMGGRLRVQSRPGVGSTFEFTARFGRASPGVDPGAGACEAPDTTRQLRVLVAEDNAVNRLVIQHMLHKGGHQVSLVTTGREAVESALTGHFDVVLMDVQMPEMDGLEATVAIRARHTGGHLPIVGITAHALLGDRERCLEAGMDDYLSKPVRRRQLDQALARAVSVMDEPEAVTADRTWHQAPST
jgi:signal transduction histidine kinase/ligand-binding sensor domain-containing protein/AmiR/NasT family two-component response regulator